MSSTGSSVRSSPIASGSDNDEEQYMGRPVRRSRYKKTSAYGINEVEQTIHKAQQDAGEFQNDYNKLQHDTQNHSKRIKDLIALARESRDRIDALLGRKSTRPDFDDSLTPLPKIKRSSFDSDTDNRGSRRSSRDSEYSRSSADGGRDYSHRQNSSDWDRRGSRDSDLDRSDGERRGSREQITYDSRRTVERQETSEQIITHTNNQGYIDVGGVTVTTSKLEGTGSPKISGSPTIVRSQKTMESTATVQMSPKVTKKPFKFGTISLQVKLGD